MKRAITTGLIIVSLCGISACDNTLPEPVPAISPAEVGSPQTDAPAKQKPGSPTIDDQIGELRENNGDIPQEERDRLNNVPAIPDVFDK